jgi:hypothetical protein
MSEHYFEDKLEERDDVVEQAGKDADDDPRDGAPWAKKSSGEADEITSD